MKYKGNKSALFVEEDKYEIRQPIKWPLIKIIVVLLAALAIFLIARRASGDALPHVEQQNWERWLVPDMCEDKCCEKENAYAMIVIDRTKANEIGGMDSILPGMKLDEDTLLSATIDSWGDIRILIFKRDKEDIWRVTYDFELPEKKEGL